MISAAQLVSIPAEQVRPTESIVLDWHDGPREGFVRFEYPSSIWYFQLHAQRVTPDGLDNRLFLLAPVPDDTMARLRDALRPLGAPSRAHWTPIWLFPDEPSRQHADDTVAELVGRSGPDQVVVESHDLTRLVQVWFTVPPTSGGLTSRPA